MSSYCHYTSREGDMGLQPAGGGGYSQGLEQLLPLHRSGRGDGGLQRWEPIPMCCGWAWRRTVATEDRRRRVWKEVLQNGVVLILKKKLIKSSSSERTNQFVQFIARTTGLINPIPVQPISGLIDWPDRLVRTGF